MKYLTLFFNAKSVEEEISYKVFLRSVRWLLVTAHVTPSSPILLALMMEAIPSSETRFLTRVTRRHILEDGFVRISHALIV
jgi:hypothetical protein